MAKKCYICGTKINEDMFCTKCQTQTFSNELYPDKIDIKLISQNFYDRYNWKQNQQRIEKLFKEAYMDAFSLNQKNFEKEYYGNPIKQGSYSSVENMMLKREYDLKQENDYQRYLRYKRESAAKSAKDIREEAKLEKLRQELDIVLD